MLELDEINQLKAKLALYEKHHAKCKVLSRLSRDTLDEALNTFGTAPQRTQAESHSLCIYQENQLCTKPQGFQIVLFDPSESTLRTRKRPQSKRQTKSSDSGRASKKQRRLWDEACKNIIHAVELPQDSELVRGQSDVNSQNPEGSTAYERGKAIAKSTALSLRNASNAELQARIELFSFLSCIVALERLGILSNDGADSLMDIVDSGHGTDYRRRIRDGAAWMNEELIPALVAEGWELDQATAVVAWCKSCHSAQDSVLTFTIDAPVRPYVYKNLRHEENKAPLIQAYEKAKELRITRWSVPQQVLRWEPNLRYVIST